MSDQSSICSHFSLYTSNTFGGGDSANLYGIESTLVEFPGTGSMHLRAQLCAAEYDDSLFFINFSVISFLPSPGTSYISSSCILKFHSNRSLFFSGDAISQNNAFLLRACSDVMQ